MKKYLPFAIFFLGIVVVVGVFLVLKGKKADDGAVTEESIPEIAFEKRPVASLTPTQDGHWLNLSIDKIGIPAATLDYELLYKLPDGRTQGVPGTVTLNGNILVERKLLLGSESSGKFRYDEGVETGTLTIRFRDNKGKLLGKLSTDFHLQTDTTDLASTDGKFKFTLDIKPKVGFYVVMETFGVPEIAPKTVSSGPYGIFTSNTENLAGSVDMGTYKVYRHIEGSRWELHANGGSVNSASGIFIGASE
jgi:hypothetical protein